MTEQKISEKRSLFGKKMIAGQNMNRWIKTENFQKKMCVKVFNLTKNAVFKS